MRWNTEMSEPDLLVPKKDKYQLWVGEGNGNPLQCSCLENPRDGGAWWAAVCGVAQSRIRLKRRSIVSRKSKIMSYILYAQAPGEVKGQGSLEHCSPWGRKELDTTEWLNDNISATIYLKYTAPNIVHFWMWTFVFLGTNMYVRELSTVNIDYPLGVTGRAIIGG